MDSEAMEIEAVHAKQRASVKWLLSKAFNNRVPENLKEPFYRDHEGQDHLKPQIVVELGNATLYCQTLSNLYSDPNYQSLNHWSILQTLARKGVPLNEMNNVQLTETVLIQTNPLRVAAHMSVIEALMVLYTKEIATRERISGVISRISGGALPDAVQGHENALLYWVSHAGAALKRRIDYEIERGAADENGVRYQAPYIPPLRSYKDLCDGVCIAFLVAQYCPNVLSWTAVRVNHLPSVEDSIHNILMVLNFSQIHLPYSVFHMTPEDVSYMRGSMRTNLIVLLADLFNLFEIHPAKCVTCPGPEQVTPGLVREGSNEHGVIHRRGLTNHQHYPVTPIPDLRSGLDSPPHSAGGVSSSGSRNNFQVARSPSGTLLKQQQQQQQQHPQVPPRATPPRDTFTVGVSPMTVAQQQSPPDDNGFVVHKGRGVPTLASMHQQQPPQQQDPLIAARLRMAKEKTNADSKAEERGDSTIAAGRPSDRTDRRPSYAGRRSRRNSLTDDSQLTIENFGGSQDHLNLIGRLDKEQHQQHLYQREKVAVTTMAEPAVAIRSSLQDARSSLQFGYEVDQQPEKQDRETEKLGSSSSGAALARHASVESAEDELVVVANKKTTTFAALPNTTTWQKQSEHTHKHEMSDHLVEDNRSQLDASKLSSVRMKLEEKRRQIEMEKRKLELALSRQQQKVGQAAFLQTINKGKAPVLPAGVVGVASKVTSDAVVEVVEATAKPVVVQQTAAQRPSSLQDFADDITSVESKWTEPSYESKKTPDLEQMDLEQYQQIITNMNVSLHDIQADIQRLAQQQSQNQAQHLQAHQLMQAQQIASLLNQYGSQQNLSTMQGGGGSGGVPYHNRSPMQQHPQMNFGSTPHLGQQQNFQSHNNFNSGFGMRSAPPNRDYPQNQYVDDQGRYVAQQANAQYGSSRDFAPPYQQQQHQAATRTNSYSPMMNNGGNGVGGGGGYGDTYGMGGDTGYQSSGPLPIQLHKNFLSRENLNQAVQQSYYSSNNNISTDSVEQYPRGGAGGGMQPQMQSNQFYLHEQSNAGNGSPPVAPQRRTWAQSAAMQQQQQQQKSESSWSSPLSASPKQPSKGGGGGGFMLHQNGNNSESFLNDSGNLFPVHTSSPQHSRVHRQISQIMDKADVQSASKVPKSAGIDDMAPQSISFIGDQDSVDLSSTSMKLQQLFQPTTSRHSDVLVNRSEDTQLEASLGKLNISSGSRTYRIPSPTRPLITSKSFQDPHADEEAAGKGFYISFDNEAPKRPKPPLRTKRSPKKEVSETISGHSSASTLDSGRSMDMQDRFGTTTRRQAPNNDSHGHYAPPVDRGFDDRVESEPIPMARNMIENNYNYDMGYQQQLQQQQQQNSQPRKHLEDVTNYEPQTMHNVGSYGSPPMDFGSGGETNGCSTSSSARTTEGVAKPIIIPTSNVDPSSVDEMERKKEKIMLLSLQRRQQQEEAKAMKEVNLMRRREKEQEKEEEKMRKKEEQASRRQAILDAHKLKKAIEEAEREGKVIDKNDLMLLKQTQQQLQINSSTVRRPQKTVRPRPKTIHVESGSVDISEASSIASSRSKKGSNSNLAGIGRTLSSTSIKRDYYRGSQDSLAIRESPDEYPSNRSTPFGRRGSYKTAREPPAHPTMERGRTMSRISVPKGAANFRGRKSNSLMNLCDTDSGLGRATPPRRAPSPGMGGSHVVGRHLPSPSGPGSLPPGLITKRRMFDDGSSDISSAQSSMMDYTGPKLYKQPAAKSNRGIILNAVEYCVFPGVVNRDAKQKVLEKIARTEAKHFLILFRDAGCQFRALYSYNPEPEQVVKLFGTGPSQVDEYMFDRFFKYNSGGKCFSQIHTKHLTVTIDAFTIHNSLWQGKKVPNLPSKKDMTLVI